MPVALSVSSMFADMTSKGALHVSVTSEPPINPERASNGVAATDLIAVLTPGARAELVTQPLQFNVPERPIFPLTDNFSLGVAVPTPTLLSDVTLITSLLVIPSFVLKIIFVAPTAYAAVMEVPNATRTITRNILV